MNSLRWYLRHAWHGRKWWWLSAGDDAVCASCGYRVKGGGREARISETLMWKGWT